MSVRSFVFCASILMALFSISHSADAQTAGPRNLRIHQHYQSVRAIGMGGAYTAVADDYATLFYNPAGLARLEEGQVNMSLGGYASRDLPEFYTDISDAGKSNDETQAYVDLLNKNFGKTYNMRFSLLQAVWVRPKWGIALLPVDLNVDLSIHQLAAAALNVTATQDTTFAYGRGWNLKWFGPKHPMSMGVTGKVIYRGYLNKTMLASDLAADDDILNMDDGSVQEGMTVDADFGLLYSPRISAKSYWRFAKPTVGVVVRNVADYGFTSNFHVLNKNSTEAPKIGRRVDLGTKFDLPTWWIFKPRIAADLRDIGHEYFTFKKGSHVGAEFLWKIRSWWQGGWRVGLNQGYLTGGFTGTAGFFTLDLVTYADDIGPSNAPKQIRSYGLRASLDF